MLKLSILKIFTDAAGISNRSKSVLALSPANKHRMVFRVSIVSKNFLINTDYA